MHGMHDCTCMGGEVVHADAIGLAHLQHKLMSPSPLPPLPVTLLNLTMFFITAQWHASKQVMAIMMSKRLHRLFPGMPPLPVPHST